MQTQFVNRTNPWTRQKMTKQNTPMTSLSLADLSIRSDPLPTTRHQPEGKYTAIFSKLKPGQCIKCPTGTASRLGQALRKWIEANKLGHRVSATETYEADGQGRVWLLAAVI